MNLKKKYSLRENLLKGRGLGLLKESTRGHTFEDTVVNYMNANGFKAKKQANYLYDMDLGIENDSEAKCEIKLTDTALLGDISVENFTDFGFDLDSEEFIIAGAADQSDAASFLANALSDSTEAVRQYKRMAKHAGVTTGQLFLRKGGTETYSDWRQNDANWHAVALPDKNLLSVDIDGSDLINYMKGKGIHYIIAGVDDENDASGASIGHLAGDPLQLGTNEVSIPNSGTITIRITSTGGGRGTSDPNAKGKFAGFRSNTRAPSGLTGLKPLAPIVQAQQAKATAGASQGV